MHSLVTVDQGGQKNRNGEMTAVFFTMFSTSVYNETIVRISQRPPQTRRKDKF
jgi:hypothetical protein